MALKYLYVPSGVQAGTAYGVMPNSASADFSSFSRSSAGSRVDKNGLINTGLGLGVEEVVDGGFDNASSWATTVATISNSRAIFIDGTGAYSNVRQGGVLTINKTYEVTIDVVINSGGGLKIQDGSGNTYKQITESGVYTFRFTSIGASSSFYIARNQGGVAYDMYVERVSVREVTEVNKDVPRLDHTGGGCPSLLLESTSTNLFKYSEDFGQSYWLHNADITTTNSSELAPNGSLNANLIEYDGSGYSFIRIYASVPSTASTLSVFAKKGNWRYFGLRHFQSSGNDHTVFDFDTETFSNTASGQTASFEAFPDGWYKIKVTHPSPEANSIVGFAISNSSGSESNTTGGQVANVHLFGAQLENQSHATSYIPNYGNAAGVTRSEDNPNSTGDLSSLIDSYPFSMYVHSKYVGGNRFALTFSDTSSSNQYYTISVVSDEVRLDARANGNSELIQSGITLNEGDEFKAAIVMQSDTVGKICVNGGSVVNKNDFSQQSINASIKYLMIGQLRIISDTGDRLPVFEARLYDEILSDTRLQELTTL